MSKVDWKELVIKAKEGNEGFVELISRIDVPMIILALKIHGRIPIEDMLQEARLKVWLSLGKVNLNHPDSIPGFLFTVGLNAMKDEIRREINRTVVDTISHDIIDTIMSKPKHSGSNMFSGILGDYETQMKLVGNISLVHSIIARSRGVSLWTVRRMFNEAASKYIAEANL